MKHGQTPFTQHHQKTRCSTRGIFQKTEIPATTKTYHLEPPPFLMSVVAHTAGATCPRPRACGCRASQAWTRCHRGLSAQGSRERCCLTEPWKQSRRRLGLSPLKQEARDTEGHPARAHIPPRSQVPGSTAASPGEVSTPESGTPCRQGSRFRSQFHYLVAGQTSVLPLRASASPPVKRGHRNPRCVPGTCIEGFSQRFPPSFSPCLL